MEVLRPASDTSSLTAPQEDVPVDLSTNRQLRTGSLFSHFGFDSPFHDVAYPHLRFSGKIDLIKSQKQPQMPEIDGSRVTNTNHENHFIKDLPKKRRFLETNPCPESYPIAKKRTQYEQKYGDVRYNETSVPYTPELLESAAGHPYSRDALIERQENMTQIGKNYYSLPLAYGIDNPHLMERVINPPHHALDASPESIKETENLLAAVQHSQMLYYSYCTQLLQNLQTRRMVQEQQQFQKYTEIRTTKAPKVQEASNDAYRKDMSTSSQLLSVSNDNKVSTTTNSSPPGKLTEAAAAAAASTSLCQSPSHSNHTWPTFLKDDKSSVTSSLIGVAGAELSSGRKRAPRALTGKHVRPGTGAAPSTLLTLRQKVAERLKIKEEDKFPAGKHGPSVTARSARSARGRKRP